MPCACSESSLLIKSLCFGDNRHKYFRFLLVFLFLFFFAFISLAWYAGEQRRAPTRTVTSTPASLRKLFLFPIWSAIQKRLSNKIFFLKKNSLFKAKSNKGYCYYGCLCSLFVFKCCTRFSSLPGSFITALRDVR